MIVRVKWMERKWDKVQTFIFHIFENLVKEQCDHLTVFNIRY